MPEDQSNHGIVTGGIHMLALLLLHNYSKFCCTAYVLLECAYCAYYIFVRLPFAMSFRVLQVSAGRAAFSVRRGSTLAGRFDVAIIGGGHNGLVAVSFAVCPCQASPLWHVASRAAGSVFAEGGEEGSGTGEETHPWRSSRDGGNHPRLVGLVTCARAEIRSVVCSARPSDVYIRTHTLFVTCDIP